jgi:hypothetical protein
MFIRSANAYFGDGSTENIYTAISNPEFVYITTNRANNVFYWKKRNSDKQVILTGGPCYDLDFDDENGLLFLQKLRVPVRAFEISILNHSDSFRCPIHQ